MNSIIKPPIFIIGNPRSGSTLLRLMLTCHKDIVVPPECGFAVWLYEKYHNWNQDRLSIHYEEFLTDLLKCRKIETWGIDRDSLLDYLKIQKPSTWSKVISCVYIWYGKSKGRQFTRWGDKNNFYLNHIQTIKEMFPEAYFVHIVRDGRNTAHSYRRLNKLNINSSYAPRLPYEIEQIAESWKKNIQTICGAFDSFGWERVVEIRLEDLIKHPEDELGRICDRIGEEYDPKMLEYHRLNRDKKLEPKEFLAWKEKTLQPLIQDQDRMFESTLNRDEISTFQRVAGDELKRYKYIS